MAVARRIIIKQMCSLSDGPDWVYANGHNIEAAQFLAEARIFIDREYGEFGPRDGVVGPPDVQREWFKRMSPSEARIQGVDWGVWSVNQYGSGCYPVTLVEV